jgi:RNA methyltransferase, TrmH family
MERITSRRHPLVSRMRELARDRRGDGAAVLLDGDHLVAEALAAGLRLVEVLADDTRLDDARDGLLRQVAATGTRVTLATPAVLEAASPVRTPSGLVAIAEVPATRDDGLLEPAPALVLVAVDVQDPDNLGAAIRAAAAAGASGVIAAGASADPLGWKSLRGSRGSAFRVPVTRAGDPHDVIDWLHEHEVTTIATTLTAPTRLWEADLRRPVALLLGGEGQGLPPAVRDRARESLSIPMAAGVESLNVAVAAALVVFEARRQRHAA